MRAPLPLRGWNGVRLYVPRMKAFSRASTAPGDSSCSNKVRSSLSDLDPPHTRAERVQRGLQLRAHAAADHVAVEQRVRIGGVQLRKDFALRIHNAGDVGDEHKRLGAERDGDGARGGVGVMDAK